MGEGKHEEHKPSKESVAATAPQEGLQQAQKRSWYLLIWLTVKLVAGSLVSAFGILPFLYQFGPSISIDVSSPLKPDDPFSVPFIITNEGYLDLHTIAVSCGIDARLSRGTIIEDSEVASSRDQALIIRPGESMTSICRFPRNFGFPGKTVIWADIVMRVSYRPSYLWWWQQERPFRFVTEKSSDQLLHWFPKPIGS